MIPISRFVISIFASLVLFLLTACGGSSPSVTEMAPSVGEVSAAPVVTGTGTVTGTVTGTGTGTGTGTDIGRVADRCSPESALYTLPCWTSYIGIVDDTEPPEWASWLRSWLGAITGYELVVDPGKVDTLKERLATRLQKSDVMVPIPGYTKNAEKMAEYLDLIHSGGVAVWRDAVRSQVLGLGELDPTKSKVFYQLGNEITVVAMSENIRSWGISHGLEVPGAAQEYDEAIIPFYVEYYLAPTIAAASDASLQVYGDRDTVQLVLGSIGDGGTPQAQAWLDSLLGYELKGDFAPSLQGKKVFELVDIISVHYIGTTGKIQPIWDRWVGAGTITGLWTTEEIGHRSASSGEGAGRALRTVANQLDWFYSQKITPAQSRVALYDWNLDGPNSNTSAGHALDTLYDFLGHSPLTTSVSEIVFTDSNFNLQQVQLVPTRNPSLLASVIWADDGSAAETINSISLALPMIDQVVDVVVHYFSPLGHHVNAYTLDVASGELHIDLVSPLAFGGRGHALLVTIQPQKAL